MNKAERNLLAFLEKCLTVGRVAREGEMRYNTRANYIKSDGLLKQPRHQFSTYDRGVDTMTDITPTQPKTKEIPLTRGKSATVDASDFDWLNQWNWYAVCVDHLWYAYRKDHDGTGKRRSISMHRTILDAPDDRLGDHINGNGLDNRRENLRLATQLENVRNRKVSKNNLAGFKGVSWCEREGKWRATIYSDGKQLHLGYYGDPVAAAMARDVASIKYHGKFARLNFPAVSHA